MEPPPDSLPLIHPSTVIIAGKSYYFPDISIMWCYFTGPSGCGKTTLVKKILVEDMFSIFPPPERIVLHYNTWQKLYEEIQEGTLQQRGIAIEFVQGVDSLALENFDANVRNLVILDDMARELRDDERLASFFLVGSHHRNVTLMMIQQSLFLKGKVSKDCALNCKTLIIFR